MHSKIFKAVESLFPNGFVSFEGSYTNGTFTIGLISNICGVAKNNAFLKARAFRREDPLSLQFELKCVNDVWHVNILLNCISTKQAIMMLGRYKYDGDEAATLIFIIRKLEQIHSICAELRDNNEIRHMGEYPSKYFEF